MYEITVPRKVVVTSFFSGDEVMRHATMGETHEAEKKEVTVDVVDVFTAMLNGEKDYTVQEKNVRLLFEGTVDLEQPEIEARLQRIRL